MQVELHSESSHDHPVSPQIPVTLTNYCPPILEASIWKIIIEFLDVPNSDMNATDCTIKNGNSNELFVHTPFTDKQTNFDSPRHSELLAEITKKTTLEKASEVTEIEQDIEPDSCEGDGDRLNSPPTVLVENPTFKLSAKKCEDQPPPLSFNNVNFEQKLQQQRHSYHLTGDDRFIDPKNLENIIQVEKNDPSVISYPEDLSNKMSKQNNKNNKILSNHHNSSSTPRQQQLVEIISSSHHHHHHHSNLNNLTSLTTIIAADPHNLHTTTTTATTHHHHTPATTSACTTTATTTTSLINLNTISSITQKATTTTSSSLLLPSSSSALTRKINLSSSIIHSRRNSEPVLNCCEVDNTLIFNLKNNNIITDENIIEKERNLSEKIDNVNPPNKEKCDSHTHGGEKQDEKIDIEIHSPTTTSVVKTIEKINRNKKVQKNLSGVENFKQKIEEPFEKEFRRKPPAQNKKQIVNLGHDNYILNIIDNQTIEVQFQSANDDEYSEVEEDHTGNGDESDSHLMGPLPNVENQSDEEENEMASSSITSGPPENHTSLTPNSARGISLAKGDPACVYLQNIEQSNVPSQSPSLSRFNEPDSYSISTTYSLSTMESGHNCNFMDAKLPHILDPEALLQLTDEMGYIVPADPDDMQQKTHKDVIKFNKRVEKWQGMLCNGQNIMDGTLEQRNENWNSVARHRKLKSRIRKGIPSPFRGEVWVYLSNSRKLRLENPGVYTNLLKKLQVTHNVHESQIEKDIERTFRKQINFREKDSPMRQSLSNVLCCYALHNPEIGYCQGMSSVIALMLCYMEEIDAFWVLESLNSNDKYCMKGVWHPNMPLINLRFYQFEHLVRYFLPTLADHFENEGIFSCSQYQASQWFITGYLATTIPYPIKHMMWDIYLNEGVKVLFRFGLAILHIFKDKLLKSDLEGIINTMRNDVSELDEAFIARSLRLKITTSMLERAEREFYQHRHSEN